MVNRNEQNNEVNVLNNEASNNMSESLINRGLSMDIRSINNELSHLFQRYSIAYNKLNGNSLFGKTQAHQFQDANGMSIKYDKGSISFKNSIDKVQYLLDNRNTLNELIGVSDSSTIYDNRRNLMLMQEYLNKLNGVYDFGDVNKHMQLYISKNNCVVSDLDTQNDWSDYILTQDWIDMLKNRVVETNAEQFDYRIEHLSEMIQSMLADHEMQYHDKFNEFDETQFIDNGKEDKFINAYNKLNSFDKLSYGFYEIFKPIGGTQEKYVKAKLFSNGILDIQGVIGLCDCTYVPYEHGSQAYLRSLNTGNKQYEFKLSIPFNDINSTLWWKPDNKEQIDIEKDEYGRPEDPVYRYYKPYETERFLRWFGTNYIPTLDLDTITKKTICSIPTLSNDIQSDKFYDDSNNILSYDVSSANIT